MVLEADGGSGSSRFTNWQLKDMHSIWAAIGGMATDPLWTHSTGWQKTYELTNENLFRLKDFRSKLADAWPPEKSEAAKAYIGKLDELITNVQEVYEAAMTNKQSCVDIAWSLSDAKRKVEPLYNEYTSNASKQSSYDQKLAAEKADLLSRYGTTTSRGYVQSLQQWQNRNPDPAVASRQDEITNQARSVMWSTSTDLTVAQSKMVIPPTYAPPRGQNEEDHTTGSGSSGGGGSYASVVPPFIPAPIPLPITPSPTGPILTSTTPPPATTVPPVTTPPVIGAPPVPPIPGGPGLPMPGMPIPPGGIIGGPKPGGTMAGMPGVIGARPTTTGGVVGGTRAPVGRAVNPVGGVIGGGAGRGPMGTAGGRRPGVGAPIGGAGRVGRKNSDEEHAEWDPDNPWEVAEGVAPVVDAPADWGPINPGPSIGGRA